MFKAEDHKAKAQRTITWATVPAATQAAVTESYPEAVLQADAGPGHQACSTSRSPRDYLRSRAAAGRDDCSFSGCARKKMPRAGQADVCSFCEAEPAGTLGTCCLQSRDTVAKKKPSGHQAKWGIRSRVV